MIEIYVVGGLFRVICFDDDDLRPLLTTPPLLTGGDIWFSFTRQRLPSGSVFGKIWFGGLFELICFDGHLRLLRFGGHGG